MESSAYLVSSADEKVNKSTAGDEGKRKDAYEFIVQAPREKEDKNDPYAFLVTSQGKGKKKKKSKEYKAAETILKDPYDFLVLKDPYEFLVDTQNIKEEKNNSDNDFPETLEDKESKTESPPELETPPIGEETTDRNPYDYVIQALGETEKKIDPYKFLENGIHKTQDAKDKDDIDVHADIKTKIRKYERLSALVTVSEQEIMNQDPLRNVHTKKRESFQVLLPSGGEENKPEEEKDPCEDQTPNGSEETEKCASVEVEKKKVTWNLPSVKESQKRDSYIKPSDSCPGGEIKKQDPYKYLEPSPGVDNTNLTKTNDPYKYLEKCDEKEWKIKDPYEYLESFDSENSNGEEKKQTVEEMAATHGHEGDNITSGILNAAELSVPVSQNKDPYDYVVQADLVADKTKDSDECLEPLGTEEYKENGIQKKQDAKDKDDTDVHTDTRTKITETVNTPALAPISGQDTKNEDPPENVHTEKKDTHQQLVPSAEGGNKSDLSEDQEPKGSEEIEKYASVEVEKKKVTWNLPSVSESQKRGSYIKNKGPAPCGKIKKQDPYKYLEPSPGVDHTKTNDPYNYLEKCSEEIKDPYEYLESFNSENNNGEENEQAEEEKAATPVPESVNITSGTLDAAELSAPVPPPDVETKKKDAYDFIEVAENKKKKDPYEFLVKTAGKEKTQDDPYKFVEPVTSEENMDNDGDEKETETVARVHKKENPYKFLVSNPEEGEKTKDPYEYLVSSSGEEIKK